MSKRRILICDDDPGIIEVVRIILEENNFEVQAIQTGKGIQKQITSFSPDLIFLDLWMPGIDGKEITKVLKRDPETKDIPIIIVSALNDTENISGEIGADGFISKPFTIDNLLAVINKNISKK